MSVSKVGPTPQSAVPSCKVCDKTVEKIQKCGRCFLVFYCGRECQMKDWPQHKPVCIAPNDRREKTAALLQQNKQVGDSSEYLSALKKMGKDPSRFLEIKKGEKEIEELINSSSDKQLLLNFWYSVFPKEKFKKDLSKKWDKLSPEERESRQQKFDKFASKVIHHRQQVKDFYGGNMTMDLLQTFKSVAMTILQDSHRNIDEKKSAQILLEVFPLIEASPDAETIMIYCSRSNAVTVLEQDLILKWSKLAPQEAVKRKQDWQKIAPQYQACSEALSCMFKLSVQNLVSKP